MGRKLAAVLLTGLFLLSAACGGPDSALPTPEPAATPSPSAVPSSLPTRFCLPYYPQGGFHPITGTNRTNLSLGGLIYESLYEVDPNFEAREALAVSSTVSEDGLTWTFTLRQGVTFSDGTPLTAQHVADCLNLARQSSLYAARLSTVTSVTPGEGTVVVRLSAPNGAMPLLLDIPIVLGEGEQPLGTGPYALTGEEENLCLTARTDWWRGETLPMDTISLYPIQETDDLLYAFDTREISLVGTDFTGSNALGYAGSYETADYATTVLLYLGFNTRSGLCRDAGLRQALSYGLDRSTIATALLSRHAVAAAPPFHPASPLWDDGQAAALAYAPQTMLELLAEAGWNRSGDALVKGRQTLSLRLLVNQDNTYKVGIADYLASSLAQSGVAVTVEKLPWEAYTAALSKGDFDLYLGEVRLTADFDLSALLNPGGALNYGGYSNATTTALLTSLRSAAGEARSAAASALAQDLAQQVPFAPLCFKNWSALVQWGQVSGITPTQQNLFYQFWNWQWGGEGN